MSIKIYFITLALAILGFLCPGIGERFFARLEAFVSKLTGARAVATIIVLSLVLNIGLSRMHWPSPRVHDEFSYLLAADTFAHGRLTNPTHPMWRYMETYHVLQTPTYMSKYPPGQGLVLALGQKLGSPVVGLWISSAAVALAVFYLLAAWLPGGWPFLGALLCIAHPMMLTWGQNFWGGCVQATGGALLLGAVSRVARTPVWKHGLVMGCGMAIAALSRPFEGAVFSAFCLLVLGVFWLLRTGVSGTVNAALRVGAGLVPMLLLLLIFQGTYNQAVTGSAFHMPFFVYEKTSAGYPVFVWRKQIPPERWNPIISQLTDLYMPGITRQQHLGGFLRSALMEKVGPTLFDWTFLGLFLIPLGFTVCAARKDASVRVGFAILAGALGIESLATFMQSHYPAPAFGLFLLLLAFGFRQMRISLGKRGICMSRLLVPFLMAASVSFFVIRVAKADHWQLIRANLETQLTRSADRNVVLVSYEPNQNILEEWVYNLADVDSQKVIWTRWLPDNSSLFNYFKGRKFWALKVNNSHYELKPLAPAP